MAFLGFEEIWSIRGMIGLRVLNRIIQPITAIGKLAAFEIEGCLREASFLRLFSQYNIFSD